MARTKPKTPVKRDASSDWLDHRQLDPSRSLTTNGSANGAAATLPRDAALAAQIAASQRVGALDLAICAGGIYATFLAWAVLQERITTTPYNGEIFTHTIALNTVQSALAAVSGYIYLLVSTRGAAATPPVFPSARIVPPLLLVSVTSSLASPFGYAALKHVGYITYILAKSCKLLPVMALHVTVFRRRYPLWKYAVVALVTAGVALFTLQGSSSRKSGSGKSKLGDDASPAWGILLLSVNLLFDGLTNSTQDFINGAFAPFAGSQMMCAQNAISTALTASYLLLAPVLARSAVGPAVGVAPGPAADELRDALAFAARNPEVGWDVLAFAACGALGQVFIFMTLAKFSSLLLVTITVTRKMLTMVLSVVWFGHRLSGGQWAGVGLVFAGVGAEAAIGRAEKARRGEEAKEGKKKE